VEEKVGFDWIFCILARLLVFFLTVQRVFLLVVVFSRYLFGIIFIWVNALELQFRQKKI